MENAQMSREYYTQEWIFLLLFFSSHIRYRDTCSNITTGIMLYPPKQNKKTDEKTVLRIYHVRDLLFFICKIKTLKTFDNFLFCLAFLWIAACIVLPEGCFVY